MKIFYKNFTPDELDTVEEAVFRSTMEQLDDFLPSAHSSCLCVEKRKSPGGLKKEEYTATYVASSSEGKFGFVVHGDALNQIAKRVRRQLRKQLSKWHQTRFVKKRNSDSKRSFCAKDDQSSLEEKCRKEGCPIYQDSGFWPGEKKSA